MGKNESKKAGGRFLKDIMKAGSEEEWRESLIPCKGCIWQGHEKGKKVGVIAEYSSQGNSRYSCSVDQDDCSVLNLYKAKIVNRVG